MNKPQSLRRALNNAVPYVRDNPDNGPNEEGAHPSADVCQIANNCIPENRRECGFF